MIHSKEKKAEIQKRIDAGEFGVGGTGGDDVPNTGINTNNALEVTTALSMITLVSAIILRKRFN